MYAESAQQGGKQNKQPLEKKHNSLVHCRRPLQL